MNGCARIDEGTTKIARYEVFKSAWRNNNGNWGDAMRSACSLQAQSLLICSGQHVKISCR